MAEKNIKKREEIYSEAYKLFSSRGYKSVFLKDIAETTNISKSLLQHYYPYKVDILNELFEQYLTTTFKIIDGYIKDSDNVFVCLTAYSLVFWNSTERSKRLATFMNSLFYERKLQDLQIEYAYQWLKDTMLRKNQIMEYSSLKRALYFSVSGGMALYYKREELNMSIDSIFLQQNISFMQMLGLDNEEISQITERALKIKSSISFEDYFNQCKAQLAWLII